MEKTVTEEDKDATNKSKTDEVPDIMGRIENGNSLLDLSKMLQNKKHMRELKDKKIREIVIRDINARIFNPITIKERIQNKNKEIEKYKSKLSRERYFVGDQLRDTINSMLQKTKIQKQKAESPKSTTRLVFSYQHNFDPT